LRRCSSTCSRRLNGPIAATCSTFHCWRTGSSTPSTGSTGNQNPLGFRSGCLAPARQPRLRSLQPRISRFASARSFRAAGVRTSPAIPSTESGCRPSSSLAAQMSKAGHVRPEEFNDRYEDAVVELIRTKQAGIPAKVTELPSRPSNVVSIMDALRKSVAAEEAAPSSAGKQHEARRGSGRRAQTKGSLEDEGQG